MKPKVPFAYEDIRTLYRPRVVDGTITKMLSAFGGVLLTGPRSCGKSWTGFNHSRSAAFLGYEDTTPLAEMDPNFALEGDIPHLVDEWQDLPKLWDHARRNIDMRAKKGMYIFTGSISPPVEKVKHTGIGRFATVEMKTMSLFESGDSNGNAKLSELFETGRVGKVVRSEIDYQKMIDLVCRGGWPATLGLDNETAIDIPYQYMRSITEMDMRRIDGKRRSRSTMETVLRSLARNLSTLAGNTKLIEDIKSTGTTISEPTLRSYLDVLKTLYVFEEQMAWQPRLRSRTRIRIAPKRQFTDPSLAAAILDAKPDILYREPETAGFFFESMCYRDLSVYASALGGRVFHYKDNSGLEVDLIVQLNDGRWGAVEAKIGQNKFKEATDNLFRMKEKMIEAKVQPPSFMMILNTTGAGAHTRDDGITEMPIDCLGP